MPTRYEPVRRVIAGQSDLICPGLARSSFAPPVIIHRFALATILTVFGIAGIASLQSEIFGVHHDDGVFLASAESVAAGHGYRLPSLPGAPPATKYPPLYPLLVSLVIAITPPFPDNLILVKLVNVACYVISLALFFGLARSRLEDDWAALVLTASLGLSPVVVIYLDYTMSESLFLTLTIAFLKAWERAVARRDASRTFMSLVLLLAILATKAIGLGIGVAAILDALRRRRLFLALLTAAVTSLWVVAWQSIQPTDVPSPLLDYYLRYEPTLLAIIPSSPHRAVEAMIDTIRHYSDGLHMIVGPAWSLPPVTVLAAYGLLRRRHTLEPLLVFGCLGILLLYPGSAPRYLLPLLPSYLLGTGDAVRTICSQAGLSRMALPAVLTMFAVAGVTPIANYVRHHPSASADSKEWQGFLETAQWLRDNTPENTVIASGYDQAYFLASRRAAVRPWRHDAFSYFHPYGKAVPRIGTAADVRADLEALGVRYVILEPQDSHVEGRAVETMLSTLVKLPPVAVPVFISEGGRRVVYRLP